MYVERGVRATAAVTFGELAEMVTKELLGSYQPTIAPRQMLLDLITELRSSHDTATSTDLLNEEGWQISRITVQGFGGIGNAGSPLVLDLVAGSTITIVRGDNGSGKTSLVGALGAALQLGRGAVAPPAGELWHADQVSDGSPGGTAEVRLVRGADTLVVRVSCPRDGESTVAAVMLAAGRESPVDLGDAWTDALLASNACFSYAALQARLQTSTDLQSYLEELLVLGPVWQIVNGELDGRAAASRTAKKNLDDLVKTARKAEQALIDRFTADARAPLAPPAIRWPTAWSDDADRWVDVNELSGGGAVVTVEVATDHESAVAQLTTQLDAAWAALDAAESALDHPDLAPVLNDLQHLVDHSALDDAHCPVCGTATRWREAARRLLGAVSGRAERVAQVRVAASALAGWVDRELTPLLDAKIDGGPVGPAQAFQQQVRSDGSEPRPALRAVADQLVAALIDPAYTAWLTRLRAASDASAEWRAERRSLVGEMVGRWRERGVSAAAADGWATAAKTLATLQLAERQRRQNDLTADLQDAVARLLPDAGIHIDEITHKGGAKQQRGVGLSLTIGGRRATLGMLSSGQRNALLLASLLCAGPAAPFGFVVIDDPVHALDDLRVDLLARELTLLAEDRQVVVLTHDARLEENLRARNPQLHTQVLRRDPVTSTVRREQVGSPPEQLLDQASTVLASSVSDGWNRDVPVSQVVGGLCRHAVDGAVRHAVMAHAVRHGGSVTEAVAALDRSGHATRARFEHLAALGGGAGALPRTSRCLDDHLPRWNDAMHGGSVASDDLKGEISSARKACKELAAWRG